MIIHSSSTEKQLQEPLLLGNEEKETSHLDEAEILDECLDTPEIPLPSLKDLITSPDQIAAMVSNISTSYNVVNISLVLPMLQSTSLYKDQITPKTDSDCASAILAGMIFGQLLGGILGDSIGRVRAMYLVMSLQIIASLGSACVNFDNNSNKTGVHMNGFETLALWRFLLGIGCGGVYPLAAVMSAEQGRCNSSFDLESNGDILHKLKRISITFSTQGVGFLLVPLVSLPILYSMGIHRLDYIWRIILGLGALPGVSLLYIRWKLYRRVSPSEDINSEENNEVGPVTLGITEDNSCECNDSLNKLNKDKLELKSSRHSEDDTNSDRSTNDQSQSLWKAIKCEPNIIKKICGTAGCWFLFDIIFYGNTLFQPIVLENAFGSGSRGSSGDEDQGTQDFHLLVQTTRDSMLLSLIALPGYVTTICLIGQQTCGIPQTLKKIQIQGFLWMAILYAIISIFWEDLGQIPWLLITLYGSTFFFSNYGPNTTTFILPSISYSPQCRSTLNGISAASGKLGALIGASMFEPVASYYGDSQVMILCACASVLACFVTICCVPSL